MAEEDKPIMSAYVVDEVAVLSFKSAITVFMRNPKPRDPAGRSEPLAPGGQHPYPRPTDGGLIPHKKQNRYP